MRQSWIIFVLLGVLLLPVFTSCIEDTLDVSSEKLNLDVHLGGDELIIPLGSGKKTLVNSILEPGDMLALNSFGDYVIEESGSMQSRDFTINPVHLQLQPISMTTGLDVGDVDVATRYVVDITGFSGTVSQTAKVTASQRVPGELKSLYSAALDASKNPAITLKFSFQNVPSNLKSLAFKNLKIRVPDFLQWAAGHGVSGQTLTLNASFNPHNGYSQTVAVEGFNFSSFNSSVGLATTAIAGSSDRLITINKNNTLTVNGQIEGGAMTVDTDLLDDMKMTVTATFNEFTLNKVNAVVDPTIAPVTTRIPINLTDDADFLKDENTQLELANPQIKLDLSNSSLLPIALNLTLRGEDGSKNVITGSDIPPVKLTLLASSQQGTPRLTKVVLSAKAVQVDGYTNIVVPELPKLTTKIPDVVKIEATANVATSTPVQVDLDKDMDIAADYDVTIPLAFDAADLNYTEIVDGLQDDLEDISEDVLDPKWTITTELVNAVPMSMHLTAEAVDTAGNIIDGVTVTTESDITAGTLNSPSTSPVTIVVEAVGDKLSQLDALKLHLHATSNDLVAGESLNGEQYIQFTEIKVRAKGGVHIDMND